MSKTKISFQDIKIGDIVLTTNNKIGEVIAIKSYAYLNDKIAKKSQKTGILNENLDQTFKFDNIRHNGIWYAVITVAIEDKTDKFPTYYTENLDFIEIQKIFNNNPNKKNTFLNKIIQKIKNIYLWV